MVPKTSYCPQDSSYSRQIQCFGRQVIENRQSSQNRVGIGSIDSKFNFPNVQLSQSGSVCDSLQSQTATLCIPSSGQSSLRDRRIFHELEWNYLHAYAFPPTMLIPSVLNKIRQSQCRIVLKAPLWPLEASFSEVLQLLVSAPVRLPLVPNLLTQAKGKFQHQNLPALNIQAWELSNNQLEIKNFRKTLQILSPDQDEHHLRKSMTGNGLFIPVGVIEGRLIRSRPLLLWHRIS